MVKYEHQAKIYVIETEGVTEERKEKTEGSQNMRSYPDELLKNKDLKRTF